MEMDEEKIKKFLIISLILSVIATGLSTFVLFSTLRNQNSKQNLTIPHLEKVYVIATPGVAAPEVYANLSLENGPYFPVNIIGINGTVTYKNGSQTTFGEWVPKEIVFEEESFTLPAGVTYNYTLPEQPFYPYIFNNVKITRIDVTVDAYEGTWTFYNVPIIGTLWQAPSNGTMSGVKTSSTQSQISIDTVSNSSSTGFTVVVRNTGSITATVSSIYMGTSSSNLAAASYTGTTSIPVSSTQYFTCTVPPTIGSLVKGATYVVKVVDTDGQSATGTLST
jgi:hypothetical protein